MADSFKEKVVAVTGGSQGIGRAIAKAFADSGSTVAIFARNRDEVEKAAEGISSGTKACEGIQLDVSDYAATHQAFSGLAKKHGRLDVLVTCAGIYGPIGLLEENDCAQWEQAIRINLCGTAFSVRAALPHMKKQRSGCIITMAGGGVGGRKIKPNFSSYTTSKFGVCGLVEAISSELDGTGITINAISPGAVNTRLLHEVLSAGEKAGKDFLETSIQQKETGGVTPDLACRLALFLASGRGKHISGKLLSAVWDKEEKLSGVRQGSSIFTLRRIDNEIFLEAKK